MIVVHHLRLPRGVPALIRPVVGTVARRVHERLIDPQLRTHLDYWEGELGQLAR